MSGPAAADVIRERKKMRDRFIRGEIEIDEYVRLVRGNTDYLSRPQLVWMRLHRELKQDREREANPVSAGPARDEGSK